MPRWRSGFPSSFPISGRRDGSSGLADDALSIARSSGAEPAWSCEAATPSVAWPHRAHAAHASRPVRAFVLRRAGASDPRAPGAHLPAERRAGSRLPALAPGRRRAVPGPSGRLSRAAPVAGDVVPPPVIEVRPGLTPAPIDSPGQTGLTFTKSINPKCWRSSNPYWARLAPLPAANGSLSQSICATSPERRADSVAYPIDFIAADPDGLMELTPAFTMMGGVLTFDPDGHLQR